MVLCQVRSPRPHLLMCPFSVTQPRPKKEHQCHVFSRSVCIPPSHHRLVMEPKWSTQPYSQFKAAPSK